MGRKWPAIDKDLQEAHNVCRQPGLGPLLGHVPRGIFRVIGQTGWQLLHGERSRIFLARTLLQSARSYHSRRELLGACAPQILSPAGLGPLLSCKHPEFEPVSPIWSDSPGTVAIRL